MKRSDNCFRGFDKSDSYRPSKTERGETYECGRGEYFEPYSYIREGVTTTQKPKNWLKRLIKKKRRK